jgi:hypothetical protein
MVKDLHCPPLKRMERGRGDTLKNEVNKTIGKLKTMRTSRMKLHSSLS